MRTTGVRLVAETGLFSRSFRGAKKDVEGLNDELDKTGKGKQLDEQAKQAEVLRLRIKETETAVAALARSFITSGGDQGILKQLKQQQRALADLKRIDRLLPNAPDVIGAGVSMGQRLSAGIVRSLPPQLTLALVGVGVSAAPLLGGAIAGGIIGGVGIGGVVGGLAIAAKDARVATSATQLGDQVQRRLNLAGGAFIRPALDGLAEIRRAVATIDIEGIFKDSSRYVMPLAEGISSAIVDLGDGVEQLIGKARPVMDVIGGGIAQIGEALGDGLSGLADNAPAAAAALQTVFEIVTSGVQTTFMLVDALTTLYGWGQKIGADTGLQLILKLTGAEMDKTAESSRKVGDGTFRMGEQMLMSAEKTKKAGDELTGMAAATAVADARIKELKESSDELFGSQLSLDRSTLAVRNGMATLAAELGKGTRTLSLNSEEGRRNRGAVLDQLAAIEQLRQSRIKHGVSLDEAGRKYVKDIDGLRKSMIQAGFTKKQIDDLLGAYRKIPNKVNTAVSSTGVQAVGRQLIALQAYQTALKQGKPVVSIRKQLSSDNADFLKYASGGPVRGPGTKTSDSIMARLSNDEHVWTADEVMAVGGHGAVMRMRKAALAGKLPGFARGGAVAWPFPTTASMTRVPSRAEAASAVIPAAPSGGATAPFMVRVLKEAFPGLRIISTFRPNSKTLSGNDSYHGKNRAVDTEPSAAAARFMYTNYKSRLKEAITPYQQYNVHNGRDRHWTGAVWNQHNFAGGNAHDHFAMRYGGTIREPVVGVGRSGATYSFGEGGVNERVTPIGSGSSAGGGTRVYQITVQAPVGSHPAEIGRTLVTYIQSYESGSGSSWRDG